MDDVKNFRIGTIKIKALSIIGISTLLLLGLHLVEGQVESRQHFEAAAQDKIAEGWGGAISFGELRLIVSGEHFRPSVTNTSIELSSKTKRRGFFQIPVYTAALKTQIKFSHIEIRKGAILDSMILEVMPVDKVQSYHVVNLTTGTDLKADLTSEGLVISGTEFSAQSLLSDTIEIAVSMRGTGPLSYHLNADQEHVRMFGNWPKPQFMDTILPSDSKVSAKGFDATWELQAMPASLKKGAQVIGLTHLWIGADYPKIERAVKFGILLVVLTFLGLLIVEFRSGVYIHPFQYGLIGAAVSIFYLLLLALSEAVGFDWAYLISSGAVIGLVVTYVHGFMPKWRLVRMVMIEQVTLSGFFYLLLSLEETAFLVGSIGLFAALALFMLMTRKFDWHRGSLLVEDQKQA